MLLGMSKKQGEMKLNVGYAAPKGQGAENGTWI